MRSLYFIGTSQDDLRAFPDDAKRSAGWDLRRVQSGLDPTDWKAMPTVGAGVREIRIRGQAGAFRVFYVVASEAAVYVLHAFQKKTQKTSQADLERGRSRFKLIQ